MVYGVVPPLIVTVAVDPFTTVTEFGVAIMLATVTGTLTVDVPALSFTTMVAVPTARPVTESVVPETVDLTFVVSEFDFTEYGTLPPDIATDAVPPTSNETDAGVAVNPLVVSPGLVGLSDLLQLVTKNIALATTTVNAIARNFFMIMVTSIVVAIK
jgi:hypothetical protein